MPVVMPNVIFDVTRSTFLQSKGTQAPVSYLQNIEGHLQTIPARHLRMNSVGAVAIQYEVRVEMGLDIRIGDIIQNIRLIDTGQLWVDDDGGIQTWRVIDPFDMTPGLISYRTLTIQRFIGGGPAPI